MPAACSHHPTFGPATLILQRKQTKSALTTLTLCSPPPLSPTPRMHTTQLCNGHLWTQVHTTDLKEPSDTSRVLGASSWGVTVIP